MSDDKEIAGLDEDSLSAFDGAKKGQARKFVMVYRGSKISRLVVFKKGKTESKIAQAKKGCSGDVCFGVIRGKGANLNFQVAIADGFDKSPATPTVLRKFLDEEADFKSQAMFEVVQEHGPVLDESDPLVARFLTMQDEAVAVSERSPGAAPAIGELCKRIGKAFDADEAPNAIEGLLKQLETVLRNPAAAAPVPPPATTAQTPPTQPPQPTAPVAPAPTVDAPAPTNVPKAPPPPLSPVLAQVRDGMFRLGVQVKQAVTAYPERKAEFLAAAAAVQEALKQSAENDAKRTFAELVALLKGLNQQSASKNDTGAFRQEWPAAKAVWIAAIEEVDEQIDRLQRALRASDDEDLVEIAEFGLNGVTGNFRTPVMKAVRELDVALDEYLGLAAQALSTAVGAFREHVKSSQEIMACDENPFNVKVTIRTTLGAAFDSLEAATKLLAK